MKHIFVIGSKGIPAAYGGFETFVDKLTEYRKTDNITYHVSCMNSKEAEVIYHNARCFRIKVPNIGPAKAVYYDIKALEEKHQSLKGAISEEKYEEIGTKIDEISLSYWSIYLILQKANRKTWWNIVCKPRWS